MPVKLRSKGVFCLLAGRAAVAATVVASLLSGVPKNDQASEEAARRRVEARIEEGRMATTDRVGVLSARSLRTSEGQ